MNTDFNSKEDAPFDIEAKTGFSAQQWADEFIHHGPQHQMSEEEMRAMFATFPPFRDNKSWEENAWPIIGPLIMQGRAMNLDKNKSDREKELRDEILFL